MSDATDLTAKQEAFCLAYLECGNASEAYRRSYNAADMAPATVNRKAAELLANGKITARIGQLRDEAAKQATLTRAWVLQRLMRNAEVSLGERTIKLRVQRKDKETGKVEVSDIEVSAHDAAAANRALELLGKTDEVQLFTERHEHSGKVEVEETPLDDLKRARLIAFILYRAQMMDGKETDDANDHTQH
jgi:phage terminase small subunit